MLHNRGAVVDGDNGGLNKVPTGWEVGALFPGSTAVQNLKRKRKIGAFPKWHVSRARAQRLHLASLRLRGGDRVGEHFDSGSIVEWSHERAGKERVADGDRAVSLDKLRDELIINFFMNVKAAEGGASLAGSTHLHLLV